MAVTRKQIEEQMEKGRKAFLADYKKLVEIPSVSMQPQHKKDIEACAKAAAELLKSAGAEATIYTTAGNPVVFGRLENQKGAPTVAVYNHLDVQPAAQGKDGWTRAPFTFAEEGGRFYSRGTTDDKGPAMTAFWAAKIARTLKVPTNIEFIWEFEEEIGSPNFGEFLGKAKKSIQANSVVVSDTIWLARGKPAVTRGLRGLLATLVTLRTGQKDVHSGLCGGAARNPVTEMCALVASCVDAGTGDIKIPGFDKTWTPPTTAKVEEFVKSGFTVENFQKAHGLDKLRYTTAADVLRRIWLSPTCEVHGIRGGYQEEGVKTIVPQWAEAKVSFRIVPGQDPEKIFELFAKHAKTIIPDCEVRKDGILEPYAAPEDQKFMPALLDAVEFGFGAKPAFTFEGGSIGAVVKMSELLKVPIQFLGLSLPEDGYHGPNESFMWEQIEGGTKAFVKYFESLATIR